MTDSCDVSQALRRAAVVAAEAQGISAPETIVDAVHQHANESEKHASSHGSLAQPTAASHNILTPTILKAITEEDALILYFADFQGAGAAPLTATDGVVEHHTRQVFTCIDMLVGQPLSTMRVTSPKIKAWLESHWQQLSAGISLLKAVLDYRGDHGLQTCVAVVPGAPERALHAALESGDISWVTHTASGSTVGRARFGGHDVLVLRLSYHPSAILYNRGTVAEVPMQACFTVGYSFCYSPLHPTTNKLIPGAGCCGHSRRGCSTRSWPHRLGHRL